MLVKELIETEEITGWKAIWTIARLPYHVKTPTPELLRELVVSNYKPFYIFSAKNDAVSLEWGTKEAGMNADLQ